MADLWVCRLKSEPTIAFISSSDKSGAAYECTQVSAIPSELKAAYWLVKTFQWIEQLPIP